MRTAMRLALLIFALATSPVLAGDPTPAALEYVRGLSPEEAAVTRFVWQPEAFSEPDRAVLDLQLNFLSRTSDLLRWRFVNPNLLAVFYDVPGWSKAVWDKQADVEPYLTVRAEQLVEEKKWYEAGYYGSTYYQAGWYTVKKKKIVNAPNPKAVDQAAHVALQTLTGTLVPIVRADWWFVQSCRQVDLRNKERGIGYYDWLGIKDRNVFFALADFDPVKSDKIGRHVRDLVERSGVAQTPRFVVWQAARDADAWFTLDEDGLNAANLPTELLKPGVFKHKAEEHFLGLPNGFPAFGLFDAGGTRQATAPDFIGPDDSPLRTGRDSRIHVCLSCVRCHFHQKGHDGMRPVDGWVRKTFGGQVKPEIVDRADAVEFQRLYGGDLEKRLTDTRRRYREALYSVLGDKWDWPAISAAYSAYYDRYVHEPVTMTRLAKEAGLDEKKLVTRMKAAPGGVPISLAGLLAGGSVRREIAEDFWYVALEKYGD